MAKDLPFVGEGYAEFLQGLKDRIRTAQVKAALAVNRELVLLYWQIGQEILKRQQEQGWGAKIIDQLAKDLKREFPEVRGFSSRNLKYMRALAQTYPDETIVQEVLAQIPWYHNIALLEKLNSTEQRLWYAQEAVKNGWSRNVLVLQIESGLYKRQGSAITNFEQALPKTQSDLAQLLLKDPYNFEFLTISQEAHELELERSLVIHIRDFLLELGLGFSFVGSQYPLVVDGTEFRLDLLFYHLQLRCFVVIDLKMGAFKPEDSGKMNFYVAVVDDTLRHETDNPTIGLILCKSKSRTLAEYALRNIQTPIGVSTHKLPDDLSEKLPTIEQLEAELETVRLSDEGESQDQA